MSSQVIALLFQQLYDRRKLFVAIKITGEKEGGFYSLLFQRLGNKISAFGEFMSCKYQRNILLSTVAPYDSSPAVCNIFQRRACFFFPGEASASFAASR